jgi:hypothetical protein
MINVLAVLNVARHAAHRIVVLDRVTQHTLTDYVCDTILFLHLLQIFWTLVFTE